jgi:putative phage-type endonuclease
MIYHNVEQNTPEWFELRKGKFTASVFSDLFMKETTAGYQNAIYKVVYEILTGEEPELFSNDWMERGSQLEQEARQVYELETFNKVHDAGFIELNEFIGCSPDGLIGNNGLVEIKCPKYSTMINYLLDKELPKIYHWQVHGQIFVSGREFCDFFAYHPKLNPVIIKVNRDEEIIKQLEDKLNESIEKVKQIIKRLK